MPPIRTVILGSALVASTFAGGALGASLIGTAGAQTDSSSTTTAPATSSTDATTTRDPSQGGHMANGITEELLTGDTADKVTAAALQAVPGGTIERVETDAEGAAYEAHMTDADGARVTVKLDESFAVTAVEQGHGR
jgi:hypothetical protein